ncbi:MAG: hypothetical protein HRF50_07680 [Phycisphaerae bacterium]
MRNELTHTPVFPSMGRTNRACRAMAALAALACVALPGCNEDEAWTAFRGAASSSLQSGVSALLQGIVDGAFAVFDLGADDSSGTTDGGTTPTTTDTTTSGSSGDTTSGG